MEFAIDNQLKTELKSKWLVYYKQNIAWISAQGLHNNKTCGNQGHTFSRPNANLIISVITAIEPKLSALVTYLCKFHSLEEIVSMLELDFDPTFALAQEESEKIGLKEVKTINLLAETQA